MRDIKYTIYNQCQDENNIDRVPEKWWAQQPRVHYKAINIKVNSAKTQQTNSKGNDIMRLRDAL